MKLKQIFKKLIVPTSGSEDSRRRQFILSALLLGILALSFASVARAVYDVITLDTQKYSTYPGIPPLLLLGVTGIFLALYWISRSRNFRTSAYILVSMIGIAGLYCLFRWGITLPTGLLILILGIVMSSILISTRFSLIYTAIISTCLLGLGYMESAGLNHPNTYWTDNLGGLGDAITFVCIIGVIAIVSWLSNREIEQSLARALRSEQALEKEKDQLEVRIVERTKQLEEAQREKIMQLYRFADFGRISSGLLHDIINPLTAVSLNLEQLSTKRRSDLVSQAIEGIKYIEQFVQSARKQIQNPNENRLFSPSREVQDLAKTLASKLNKRNVRLQINISSDQNLFGSQIKFHQLISNLLSNAIDAYENFPAKKREISIALTDANDAYELQVIDFGKGISEVDIEKIFEPFFTTKTDENGTGIGLFISKRIVEEDFGGHISVVSTPSTGTSFIVRLPKRS